MTSQVFRLGLVGVLFSTLTPKVYAAYSVTEQLKAFHSNPKNYMNDRQSVQKFEQTYIPTKVDESGYPIEFKLESEKELSLKANELPFPAQSLPTEKKLGGGFVDIKNKFHEGLGEEFRPGRAEYKPNDNPEIILGKGNLKYKNLRDMERKQLTSGRVEDSPWSDDYWPIYSGQIAKRYADDKFPESGIWSDYANAIIHRNASSEDDMSPAEKYELITGDTKRLLSNAMLDDGRTYADRNQGKVERWMGLCHGWAPAAINVKRPKHDIKIRTWDKSKTVHLYPSDIKALATLLWAKAKTPTLFMGSRCDKKDPETDANGRILNDECFDTNPGAWHLSLINQVGYHKKSMIIDATFDYEVWNQPLYAYEYTYFNPETLEQTKSLSQATVDLRSFSRDKFSKYRSPSAKKIVGIAMKLTYLAETAPSHRDRDSEDRDRRVAVNYLYDLELDDHDNIIGGEWYTNLHPDFIWNPAPGTRPKSSGDEYLATQLRDKSKWHHRSKNPIPESWQRAALKSSSEGMPLAKIVDDLVERSRRVRLFH